MYAFLSEVKEDSFSSVVHYDSWFISPDTFGSLRLVQMAWTQL